MDGQRGLDADGRVIKDVINMINNYENPIITLYFNHVQTRTECT